MRAADLAVDLGTANTVVFRRGAGIVLFEPSVVAMDDATGRVYAVGEEARRMLGRTPGTITASRPLRHGVITDFDTTEEMLRQFIQRASGGRARASVIVCVPSGLTQVERNAVAEATVAAGAREVSLIDEPLAAAIGAGLPVAEPVGSLVVDVGGGTTEMAVTALGGMVVSDSVQVGGYDFDDAIVRLAHQHKLLVGQEQAEQVKIEIGRATDAAGDDAAQIAGRDLSTGTLRRLRLEAAEVARALRRPVDQIVEATTNLLERTPAELSADVADRGVTLVGGGSLLRGLGHVLGERTGLIVTHDPEPMTTVARGAGAALADIDTHRRAGKRNRRGNGWQRSDR